MFRVGRVTRPHLHTLSGQPHHRVSQLPKLSVVARKLPSVWHLSVSLLVLKVLAQPCVKQGTRPVSVLWQLVWRGSSAFVLVSVMVWVSNSGQSVTSHHVHHSWSGVYSLLVSGLHLLPVRHSHLACRTNKSLLYHVVWVLRPTVLFRVA